MRELVNLFMPVFTLLSHRNNIVNGGTQRVFSGPTSPVIEKYTDWLAILTTFDHYR